MGAEPQLLIEKVVSGRQVRSDAVKTTEIKDGPFKGLKIHEGEVPGEKPGHVPFTNDPKWPHAALHAKVKVIHHGPIPDPDAPAAPVEKVEGIRAPVEKPAKKVIAHGRVNGKVTHFYEDGTQEEM